MSLLSGVWYSVGSDLSQGEGVKVWEIVGEDIEESYGGREAV